MFSDPCSVQSVESESCKVYLTSTQVDLVWHMESQRVSWYGRLLIFHCCSKFCKLFLGLPFMIKGVSPGEPILSIKDLVNRGTAILIFLYHASEEILKAIILFSLLEIVQILL